MSYRISQETIFVHSPSLTCLWTWCANGLKGVFSDGDAAR